MKNPKRISAHGSSLQSYSRFTEICKICQVLVDLSTSEISGRNTPTAVSHIPNFGDAISGAGDGQLSACGYIYTRR
jgi:hypothetical protein